MGILPTFLTRGEQKYRPVIARTDRECLILKGIVFEDGKKYDVRIWEWDAQGNFIPIDENTPFSTTVLSQIQDIAAHRIFNSYPSSDLPNVRIFYHRDPENCESQNCAKGTAVDLMDGYEEIVDGMRDVYQLLHPQRRAEWTRDASSLVVRPTLIHPSEIAAQTPKAFAKNTAKKRAGTRGFPVIPPSLKDSATSTEDLDASLDQTRPVDPMHPHPPVKSFEEQLLEDMDETIRSWTKGTELPFLKDISYAALAQYSKKKDKKPQDGRLHAVYRTFGNVLNNPTVENVIDPSERDRMTQMIQWLRLLYIAAYRHYQRYETVFENEKGNPFQEFGEWCKYYAANAVVGFIYVQKTPMDPLVEELQKIEPPSSENISLDS